MGVVGVLILPHAYPTPEPYFECVDDPDERVSASITCILKSYFHGHWPRWTAISKVGIEDYWKAFKVWLYCASRAFSSMLNKARDKAKQEANTTNIAETRDFWPEWMDEEIWKWLIDNVWIHEKWKKISEVGSANRLIEKDGSITKHTSGSIPMLVHWKRLERNHKRVFTRSEVFDETHKRKNGDFVDNKSKSVSEKYSVTFSHKYTDSTMQPAFDAAMWRDAAGGVGHGHLYGFGRKDPRDILEASHSRGNFYPSPSAENRQSSQPGTQSQVEDIVKKVLDGLLDQRVQDVLRGMGYQIAPLPMAGNNLSTNHEGGDKAMDDDGANKTLNDDDDSLGGTENDA
ncbi:Transposase, Ptta/En/Spm, plant [Corchorus capsularis]|uniref:Transposase, Ptta/En/Spm, plant n=1 Tax=Corchorus capsularis TaxID=210143 RepID=A0A1R3J0P4_COCAP|nr:Transposase, Ptta/En/Spm, plant [Corchorus capsularis]